MITIQYLEPGQHIAGITPSQARLKLRAAINHLPIDCLLMGWDVPYKIHEVCQNETNQSNIKLYRWQPLLTGDGTIYPKIKWRTRNVNMVPVNGYLGLAEFTFMCPNNPEVRTAILTHVADLAHSGIYDGIFLDRMRYPSPAADSVNSLTCFCEHCHTAAHEYGLDLENIRHSLVDAKEKHLLRVLSGDKIQPLSDFFDFRQHTITQFISAIVDTIRFADLEIGLDCFSPILTRMVGQDLSALAPLANWTKVMVYGHAFGPASLPFEITNLANWLIEQHGIKERESLSILAAITNLPLPVLLSSLRDRGLFPDDLAAEYDRGRQVGKGCKLLAGVELVEIPNVSELNTRQIEADLKAIKSVGAEGLSISWDLWHIPLERLKLVNTIWFN